MQKTGIEHCFFLLIFGKIVATFSAKFDIIFILLKPKIELLNYLYLQGDKKQQNQWQYTQIILYQNGFVVLIN